jgi:hypothetical protein
VNRDSGTASANGGWLRRLVRPHQRHNSNKSGEPKCSKINWLKIFWRVNKRSQNLTNCRNLTHLKSANQLSLRNETGSIKIQKLDVA